MTGGYIEWQTWKCNNTARRRFNVPAVKVGPVCYLCISILLYLCSKRSSAYRIGHKMRFNAVKTAGHPPPALSPARGKGERRREGEEKKAAAAIGLCKLHISLAPAVGLSIDKIPITRREYLANKVEMLGVRALWQADPGKITSSLVKLLLGKDYIKWILREKGLVSLTAFCFFSCFFLSLFWGKGEGGREKRGREVNHNHIILR